MILWVLFLGFVTTAQWIFEMSKFSQKVKERAKMETAEAVASDLMAVDIGPGLASSTLALVSQIGF